jgi:hypothetical protein
MGQESLFDEKDGIFAGVKGDGAVVPGAAFQGDIH